MPEEHTDETQAPELPEQVIAKPRPRRRYPCVAAVLSMLVPGLGHLYAGRPRAAVWLYVFMFLLPFGEALTGLQYSFRGFIAMVVIELAAAGIIMVHSAVTASRAGSPVPRPYQRWYIYLLAGTLALSLGLASDLTLKHRAMGVKAFKIPSGSMEPTILIGDHIVAALGYYGSDGPSQGDIVVFRDPKDTDRFFIKRIVAVGGDTVAVRDKVLYVNGEPLDEPYAEHLDDVVQPVSRSNRDNMGPVTVPRGDVFVMGDNRDHSFDSRYWGPLKKDLLVGRALFIYWSWDAQKNAPRLGRMGNTVQ